MTDPKEEEIIPTDSSPTSWPISPSLSPSLSISPSLSPQPSTSNYNNNNNKNNGESLLEGITFEEGKKFQVPKLWGPVQGSPAHWCLLEWLGKLSVLNLLLPFFHLPTAVLVVWFLIWRFGYDLGIGLLLRWQSRSQGITKLAVKILSMPKDSFIYKMFKSTVIGDRTDFDFDTVPPCFCAWVFFRSFVDIILANDLMAYIAFGLSCITKPEVWNGSTIFGYLIGVALCAFALWAKTDSYRVVKDYAWYWGDFFFLVKAQLTFDRVFKVAPHPMYTIGYSFFYGAALISRSYVVLYVSLFAHFCQLAFLAFFETPHMKKIYPELVGDEQEKNRRAALYDSKQGYFGGDLLGWKNFNPLRFSDIAVLVCVLQSVLFQLFVPSGPGADRVAIAQVVIWRIMISGVLGLFLYLQSKNGWFERQFTNRGMTKRQAFDHWKGIYNLTHTMAIVSFTLCSIRLANFTSRYYLKQTIGLVLLAISGWSYFSSYEVLGDYGWFYGDFFINDMPTQLQYNGIYRFMDNPDSIVGYAGLYGLALIAESKTMLLLALFSQVANFLFVVLVERGHMRRIHKENLRESSGIGSAFQEILTDMIDKNPTLRELNEKAQEEYEKFKLKLLEEVEKLHDKKISEGLKQRVKLLKPQKLINAIQIVANRSMKLKKDKQKSN